MLKADCPVRDVGQITVFDIICLSLRHWCKLSRYRIGLHFLKNKKNLVLLRVENVLVIDS